MTEETRAELRRLLDGVFRSSVAGDVVIKGETGRATGFGKICSDVAVYYTPADPPPLTTAQQLALSVLLGDDAVLPDALADYLLDKGHEYAAAVAEKARRDERERIVGVIMKWVDSYSLRSRLLIEIDGREVPGFAPGGPDAEEPKT